MKGTFDVISLTSVQHGSLIGGKPMEISGERIRCFHSAGGKQERHFIVFAEREV